MPWVPAHPKQAYATPAYGLRYSRIYVATTHQRLPSNATLGRGFSTTFAPRARPRLFMTREGDETVVKMSDWTYADEGTIYTTGLDSCVAIALGAWSRTENRFSVVAMAHLTGSYYPGGKGMDYNDGDWGKLFALMPDDHPSRDLYAIVAGSSHRGGWYADGSVQGGAHSDNYPSNPDRIWEDLWRELAPTQLPHDNFLFYSLAPGINHTMGFGIRLRDGQIGEV